MMFSAEFGKVFVVVGLNGLPIAPQLLHYVPVCTERVQPRLLVPNFFTENVFLIECCLFILRMY